MQFASFTASGSVRALNKIYSLLGFSRCMPILIFLASVQAVITNITFFLSKFIMFLNIYVLCFPGQRILFNFE